ncbi:MAG: hypothetical protein Ct9H300mP32_4150 [Verrucomicrobiota bacterium]|nr:MAG: hypothetical protein Ct9H300mP32_4150 [Verrucomicrobiota bacterium]
MDKAAIKTLDLPFATVVPFIVMILASLVTKPNSRQALDRLYVKMKTPVDPDPAGDRAQMERSYAQPDRFDERKLFPGSSLEFHGQGRWISGGLSPASPLFWHHRIGGVGFRHRHLSAWPSAWLAGGIVYHAAHAVSVTGEFPSYRPRACAARPHCAVWFGDASAADQLVLPLFVRPGRKVRNAVPQCRGGFSCRSMRLCARPAAHKAGVRR